jgi:hypothetical protein
MTPSSFTSMLGVSATAEPTGIERITIAVSKRADELDLNTSLQVVRGPSVDDITLDFKFEHQTSKVVTHASITIRYTASGGASIHATQGFPIEFISLVHDLPALASGWQDSTGAQARAKSNPAASKGRAPLVAQPDDAATQTGRQVCAAAVAIIDLGTVAKEIASNQRTRRYIGASSIGVECMAYHALSLRGFPGDMPSPQLLRIFGDGHRIETQVVEALVAAGHVVEELDPATGQQWEYNSHGDHHSAHLDGFITLIGGGERMALEIKSMNRKMFESFQKKGVHLSHPHYVDQCVDGMHLARSFNVPVSKCFFIAYCKDNSQYHAEIIEYDSYLANKLLERVADAIAGVTTRISSNKHEYKCSTCHKRTSCWEPNVAVTECHHCEFATSLLPVAGGKKWFCQINQKEATAKCGSFKLFRPEAKP